MSSSVVSLSVVSLTVASSSVASSYHLSKSFDGSFLDTIGLDGPLLDTISSELLLSSKLVLSKEVLLEEYDEEIEAHVSIRPLQFLELDLRTLKGEDEGLLGSKMFVARIRAYHKVNLGRG
ncbi:hypothetical protein Tco_0951725 [Tanacetum coccineum]|uniref:Uncharacterized protein n=1 Tax=Tanacetum coccineum TaxID=301880 RepID=A0ABQ5DUZ3_9ASTR